VALCQPQVNTEESHVGVEREKYLGSDILDILDIILSHLLFNQPIRK
jgi:hypothetical protein